MLRVELEANRLGTSTGIVQIGRVKARQRRHHRCVEVGDGAGREAASQAPSAHWIPGGARPVDTKPKARRLPAAAASTDHGVTRNAMFRSDW
jgi:hypothetical protein